MTARPHSSRWPLEHYLVVLLVVAALVVTTPDGQATAEPSRPAPTKPAEERDQERLLGIRAATLAALDYAKAHDRAIPTTEQLAKHMKVAPGEFNYRVLLSGSLDKHMERVKGDWPEVLIAEKQGGQRDKWAFGYVDGLCTIDSAAGYTEMNNAAALDAISKVKAKQPKEQIELRRTVICPACRNCLASGFCAFS